MASKPTVLILGAGANIGLGIAKVFHDKGWSVAAATRTVKPEVQEVTSLVLQADFADVSSIQRVWDETVSKLGTPSVVVYNAFSVQRLRMSHPLTLTPADLSKEMAVNVLSSHEAARLATAAWLEKIPVLDAGQKTPVFIHTGNIMNTLLLPSTMGLGMCKNAVAYFIECAAVVYKGKFRFYYADERLENGDPPKLNIDGDAHGTEYWDLVHGVAEKDVADGKQGEWCWTFAKGKGYQPFNKDVNRPLMELVFPGLE